MAVTITPKQLANSLMTTGTAQTVYTVPASTTTLVKSLQVTNTTAAATLIDVYIVASGGSASTTNAIVYTYSLAAKLQWSPNASALPYVLTAGMTIRVKSSVANAANINVNGVEITTS